MLNLNKVAVTGGLSCGKSTVCRLFQQLGATVVSADEIVHRLLTPESSTGKSVIALLGSDIVVDGKIDRQKIAELVFNDPLRNENNKLKRLESLLHPEVRKEIDRAYEEAKTRNSTPLFIAEIPLLFETSREHEFDAVIVVVADPGVAEKRFKGTLEAYNIRNAHQMSLEEKIKKSPFILHNNGSLEELKLDVQNLYNQLKMP